MRKRLVGIGAAPGLGVGRAVLVQGVDAGEAGRAIAPDEAEAETHRFEQAAESAAKDLRGLQRDVAGRLGKAESEIIGAQVLMVLDPSLAESVARRIRQDLVSAEKAVLEACEEQAKALAALEDKYLAARAVDVRDIGRRVARCLMGLAGNAGALKSLVAGSVLVADDLAPSDAASLDVQKVAAIVLYRGGRTSHTAILARSLGIPAVMGVQDATAAIGGGDLVLVDGDRGEIWVDPDARELTEFNERAGAASQRKRKLALLRDMPAVTVDGRRVELAANIGGQKEAILVREAGAEGVGLFRTEFLFIDREDLPSEDEQFQVYSGVLSELAPCPVIIRTLDAGGDKDLPCLGLPPEDNPFLGLRAIRLCLKEKSIFRTQLRALMRASTYGNLRIMFPMVADISELRAARRELESVKAELTTEGVSVSRDMQVGIMVEVPSAAIQADVLAGECDFFSIGTNDLVQYTMASDRGNPSVEYLSDPFYPAVLRLICRTTEEGHKRGIWVGMCGEMAGMPVAIPLLVGMGIDELSMVPASVPRAKEIVRGLEYRSAASIWQEVREMTSNTEIRSYLEGLVPQGG